MSIKKIIIIYIIGQTPIKQRLEEIEIAVASGATEIDIVISRAFVLEGNWEELYNEVKAMRKACGDAHLKTIIATGTVGVINYFCSNPSLHCLRSCFPLKE